MYVRKYVCMRVRTCIYSYVYTLFIYVHYCACKYLRA